MLGTNTIKQLIESAQKFSEAGELAQARNLLKLVLVKNPKNNTAKQQLRSLEKRIKTNKSQQPPQHIINNLIKLMESSQIKTVLKEVPLILEAYPNSDVAWTIYARALQLVGKIENALKASKNVLRLKPKSPEALNNHSVILRSANRFDKSLQYASKAIDLKEDYFDAHFNVALCHVGLKQANRAITALNICLSIEPKSVPVYQALASVYLNEGNLEKAIAAYGQALKLNPKDRDTIDNLLTLVVQGISVREEMSPSAKDVFSHLEVGRSKTLKNLVLSAIASFLDTDLDEMNKHLEEYYERVQSEEHLNAKDERFCKGYAVFLTKLSQEKTNLRIAEAEPVFHIGESHCLSFKGYTWQNNQHSFYIEPKLVLGAKAFHFSGARENAYKSITQEHLSAIPSKAKVLLSFGEIDCRLSEGIISASQRNDVPIDDVIKSTVSGYLEWFHKQNQKFMHDMVVLNIPAPLKKRAARDVSEQLKQVIELFNKELDNTISQYNFSLFDIYSSTLDKNGYSNEKYHIDDYHISRSILSAMPSPF